MFGESESESPRVPSPWDSLISTPSSPSSRSPSTSPSPLSIPRLVPEADEGNVEYKLQLLSPSPARFARLVTQLKWRLLEGGGQAYYELGVADSGALVGLPRAELEQSLETLEMMAGEIGASVIVVKEIEVPAVMAGLAASQTDKWNGERKRRVAPQGSKGSTTALTPPTETETEEPSTTDVDDEDMHAMARTVVLNGKRPCAQSTHSDSSVSLFAMDPDDVADTAFDEPAPHTQPSRIAIDLEIASVFKPRPMRARMQMQMHAAHASAHSHPVKSKRLRKIKHITHPNSPSDSEHHHARARAHGGKPAPAPAHVPVPVDPAAKAATRRQTRDRRREERRKALLAAAAASLPPEPAPAPEFTASPSPGPVPFTDEEKEVAHEREPTPAETDALVSGLAGLHVDVDAAVPAASVARGTAATDTTSLHLPDEDGGDDDEDDDDDVFATPLGTSVPSGSKEKHATETEAGGAGAAAGRSRLIVEALVVRKMSLDEAFLDFGGFAVE
ncbi:putative GTPase activity [Lyophyllum shimeji]|uniref:GTPase activity n=1 Tax=Lyophyllum shimeji TaxID=47721 RepID=A0A9P3PTR2_LYOSH|nr:putative GTPase activity [Lyophyllum shimeji]